MKTSTDYVTEAIRDLILDGTLPMGLRLAEKSLATRLGTSRTPVREALSRLEGEGLVEIRPNAGARVAKWDAKDIENIFDVRCLLEPEIAALATINANPLDAKRLETLAQEAFEVAHEANEDGRRTLELGREFHAELARIADQSTMARSLSVVMSSAAVIRNKHSYRGDWLDRSLHAHLEISAAVREGDPVWARAAMLAHLRNGRAAIISSLTTPSTPDQ